MEIKIEMKSISGCRFDFDEQAHFRKSCCARFMKDATGSRSLAKPRCFTCKMKRWSYKYFARPIRPPRVDLRSVIKKIYNNNK